MRRDFNGRKEFSSRSDFKDFRENQSIHRYKWCLKAVSYLGLWFVKYHLFVLSVLMIPADDPYWLLVVPAHVSYWLRCCCCLNLLVRFISLTFPDISRLDVDGTLGLSVDAGGAGDSLSASALLLLFELYVRNVEIRLPNWINNRKTIRALI